MSFERFPRAAATTTTDTPVIITPGHTIDWPEQVILTIGGTPDGATGWAHTFDPRGSGANRVTMYAGPRLLGPEVCVRATLTGGLTSVHPTPTLTIYRTVRGLIPGRQYRLSARVTPDGGGTRARIRMGGQAAAWTTETATMPLQTVTFTATGDEEDLLVDVEDNPGSLVARAGVELAVMDITVTGLAFTQTVPDVVDDQVPLTVYDGKVTADAGWAPFIQSDITVPLPSADVAAALDPNDGSRVRLTTSGVRELVPQFTPWTVARRNIHPDPAHTGTSRAISGGILMSCYEQMAGSNVGTTEKPNRFLLADNGVIAQEINVKTLPSGAAYGLSMTTNPPASSSTKARIYLNLLLDTFAAGGAVPTTMTAGIRVIQGTTTLLTRTQNFTANGLTQFVVNEVTLNTTSPVGIRVEVYIINRAATTWTTPGTTVGVKARIQAASFGIADTDVAVTPIITDAITVGGTLAKYLRYRKASNTVVEETRQDAPATLETVDGRTFDLAVAEKRIDYEGGEMRLTLASDEYLLQRFAKPVDDRTPRVREHSLRSVCEYVLGESISVAPPLSGTIDRDVTAYWAATNVLPDPMCTSAANYASGGNATGLTSDGIAAPYLSPMPQGKQIYWTAPGPGQSFIEFAGGQPPARAGEVWTLQAYMRRGGLTPTTGRLRFYEISATGATLRTVESDPVAIITDVWTLYSLTIKVQNPLTASIKGYATVQATAAGQVFALTAPMLHQAGEVIPPFSGNVNAVTGYVQAWNGAMNASASTRTPITPRDPQALTWAAGQTAWDFLQPLVNGQGLRLWCDESRVWHLTDPDTYTAPGRLTVTPATTIDIIDRVDGERGRYADGVVITWTWTDASGEQRTLTEVAGTEGKIATLTIESAYPGAGTAAAYLAKLQRRAVERPVTVASDYRATPDQAITITGPDGTTSEGEIAAVTWTLTDGLMQIEPVDLTTVP